MIWLDKRDRRIRDWNDWRPWFAWYPVEVRVITKEREYHPDYTIDEEYYTLHVWLSKIERRRDGSFSWSYRLGCGYSEEIKMRMEAIRLAPKFAKQIILMSKTG